MGKVSSRRKCLVSRLQFVEHWFGIFGGDPPEPKPPEPLPPLAAAIVDYCLSCSKTRHSVRNCLMKSCALYPYRTGKPPEQGNKRDTTNQSG
jgi:hypothetical protein